MKLIKIAQDHYIIVDDSKIKEGDVIYLLYGNTPSTKQGGIARCEFPDANNLGVLWKKITHSTQPLEYSSKIGKYWGRVQPIELSEVKELIGEVDVEKMIEVEFNKFQKENPIIPNSYFNPFKLGVLKGYNQALKDNKGKKWTEEDMKVAITQAFLSGVERLEDFERVQEMILDNIKPKTEWEVEFVDGKLTLKK